MNELAGTRTSNVESDPDAPILFLQFAFSLLNRLMLLSELIRTTTL
jgi:hypothetical protein